MIQEIINYIDVKWFGLENIYHKRELMTYATAEWFWLNTSYPKDFQYFDCDDMREIAFRRDFAFLFLTPAQLEEYKSIIEAAKFIGAGLCTIGVIGAGIGIGQIFCGFLLAYARNPNLANAFFGYVLLGFALCEAIALFALMMAFLVLFM